MPPRRPGRSATARVSEVRATAPVVAPLEDIGDGAPSELPRSKSVDTAEQAPGSTAQNAAGLASAAVESPAEPSPEPEAASREERVREAAYARYLQRNGAPGDATNDWLEAERLLAATDPHPSIIAP